MADPINVKVVCFSRKANPLLDGIELKYCRLIQGPPKPKGKIQNPENVAPGGPKCGMKNALFLNILAPMYKTRNIVYQ
jgi:hypothetical protein